MGDPSRSGDPGAAVPPLAAPATSEARAVERRPYRAPKLRLLGCVRELTLGGSSGFAEGAGSFIRAPM
jgi:hypothetical protein